MEEKIVASENMVAGRITHNPNPRRRKYYEMADGSPIRDFDNPDEFKKALASGAVREVAAPSKTVKPVLEPEFNAPKDLRIEADQDPVVRKVVSTLRPEELLNKLAVSCRENGAYLVDQNGHKIKSIDIRYNVPQAKGVSFE
jgi:hypothetical protein